MPYQARTSTLKITTNLGNLSEWKEERMEKWKSAAKYCLNCIILYIVQCVSDTLVIVLSLTKRKLVLDFTKLFFWANQRCQQLINAAKYYFDSSFWILQTGLMQQFSSSHSIECVFCGLTLIKQIFSFNNYYGQSIKTESVCKKSKLNCRRKRLYKLIIHTWSTECFWKVFCFQWAGVWVIQQGVT